MKDTLNLYPFTLQTWDGESTDVGYSLPPLREIPHYVDNLASEAKLLEFICKEEEGWSDQFTDESIYALLDEVGEQMDPRVTAWIDRQAAKLEKINAAREKLGLPTSTGTASLLISQSKPDGPSQK